MTTDTASHNPNTQAKQEMLPFVHGERHAIVTISDHHLQCLLQIVNVTGGIAWCIAWCIAGDITACLVHCLVHAGDITGRLVHHLVHRLVHRVCRLVHRWGHHLVQCLVCRSGCHRGHQSAGLWHPWECWWECGELSVGAVRINK